MIEESNTNALYSEPPVRRAKTIEGIRVMVVDDDPDARELVGIVLEQQGASAILVDAVGKALEILDEHPVDIVVCDIGMPKEDGFSLIRQLRARAPERGGHIPAIALTAFSQPKDREQIIQAGFQFYISKPVEPSDLVLAVSRLSRSTINTNSIR